MSGTVHRGAGGGSGEYAAQNRSLARLPCVPLLPRYADIASVDRAAPILPPLRRYSPLAAVIGARAVFKDRPPSVL